MSCLGKVFTDILNNRLVSLSDEIGLLSSAQIGFRNAHSTADNMFACNVGVRQIGNISPFICSFFINGMILSNIWKTMVLSH
jgi:hypothetical protein